MHGKIEFKKVMCLLNNKKQTESQSRSPYLITLTKVYVMVLEPFYTSEETVGQEEKIRMEFSANPKPSVGVWTINGTTVPVSGADTNNMYVSGAFEEKVKTFTIIDIFWFNYLI